MFGRVFSERRLPVSVGRRSDQKVMLLVILDAEAELTDGDILADRALILRFVEQIPLATSAFKPSVILGHAVVGYGTD